MKPRLQPPMQDDRQRQKARALLDADKAGDELQFPADRHVMTPKQREVPSPVEAIANAATPALIRAVMSRIRSAAISQKQRDSRARQEALAILECENARRDAIAHGLAPTVQEDLQAVRRRPLDAPMATRLDADDTAWAKKTDYRLDDVIQPAEVGRLALTLLLMAASFIFGMMVGRWT